MAGMADFHIATLALQENLRRLDGNQKPEALALWTISNALLVINDALIDLDTRVRRIEQNP